MSRVPYRKRAARRAQQRKAASAKAVIPIEAAVKDPLMRTQKSNPLVKAILVLILAVFVHAAIITVFFAASSIAKITRPPKPKKNDRIQVAVVQPPPPPKQVEPPPPPPEPPPPEPEQPKPKPKPKPKKPRVKPPKPPPKDVKPPPPDPIDVPDEPPPPPKKKPRRIVGLSLESTVEGGGGPSFAVGNTRMGQTERTAEDTKDVEKLAPATNTKPPPPANRRATRVPTGTGKIDKPQVLQSFKPEYPELLRAQNVEDVVKVEVRLNKKGKVTSARVVAPSKHKEFNKAALAGAKKFRFAPAKRDGVPISYTVVLTIRFQLND